MSLYSFWLEAHKKGILAPEWELAINFFAWAKANKYKPEYGYEGKFTPDNLRAAILKAPNAEVRATVADAFGLPEKILEKAPDFNPDFYTVPNQKEEASAVFDEALRKAAADIEGGKDEAAAGAEAISGGNDQKEAPEDPNAGEPGGDIAPAEEKTEIRGHFDANDLYMKLKIDELKKLAADMGIAAADIPTKRPITKLIADAEVVLFINSKGEWADIPDWVKANPALINVKLRKEEG